MRAVVTGGAGFLGSCIIEHLIKKNYQVVCLDRAGCDRSQMDKLGIPVITCDVLNPATVAPHLQAGDHVFHLAAYLGKAKVTKEQFYEMNVDAAVEICRTAIEKKAAAFVFPSSMAAMGPVGSPERPMTEDTPCEPVTDYGRTKLEAEKRLTELAAGRITCFFFRLPPFFGPRMNRITSSYILFNNLRKKTTVIVGSGENFFPLSCVENLALGMVDLSEKHNSGIHTYLLADGAPVKFNDILMSLREAFGVNKCIIHIPYRFAYGLARLFEQTGKLFHFTPLVTTDIIDGMSRSVYFYDISKAQRDGYVPGITLEQGIKITTDWMKKA